MRRGRGIRDRVRGFSRTSRRNLLRRLASINRTAFRAFKVRWEKVEVSLRDAYKIRRIYRKLAKRKASGFLHRITVFVRHENVVRLLEFLGYHLE